MQCHNLVFPDFVINLFCLFSPCTKCNCTHNTNYNLSDSFGNKYWTTADFPLPAKASFVIWLMYNDELRFSCSCVCVSVLKTSSVSTAHSQPLINLQSGNGIKQFTVSVNTSYSGFRGLTAWRQHLLTKP